MDENEIKRRFKEYEKEYKKEQAAKAADMRRRLQEIQNNGERRHFLRLWRNR